MGDVARQSIEDESILYDALGINAELVIQQPNAEHHQYTSYGTDYGRAQTVCHITACGNCNQSGK